MPRPDPAPHSNPAASEEALELSAGVNDAIPDVMSVEKNDSTDSRFSDRKREPILATLAAVATLPANGGPTLSVNAIPTAAINPTLLEPDESADEKPEKKGLIRWVVGGIVWLIRRTFCLVSLTVILAVLTAIPILQLISFGYLLNVSGRLANGSKLKDSLPHLQQAGQIGLAAIALFLAALPTQTLAHLESVANLINQGSEEATQMRALAVVTSMLMTAYLLWAWNRGGHLANYLWPQPKRFLKEGWRWRTWRTVPDRLWEFTVSLQAPKYFWLGLRGAAGTLIWLSPSFVIIATFRNGETGLAGLVGFAALLMLGVGMLYLPMLQAHFAAENRLRALFAVRTIRRDFRRAPWAWFAGMTMCLVITPIPLYLLKIEPTLREVMWAPCLIFMVFSLPARMATGLALRRAKRMPEPTGLWKKISRNLIRLVMPLVLGIYLLFVYGSQYTSWDGLTTWVQQHAIFIPVPFLNGV
ncbi:MAG: DUF4013 domain-containing protein [Rubripirellula sp.]|nr:DUF4013 domain-containing protein [Rubripirellula sp.]